MQTSAANELEIGKRDVRLAQEDLPQVPAAGPVERPYLLPTVLAGSVLLHGMLLAASSLLPGLPEYIAADSELVFQVVEPMAEPEPLPEPEPEVVPEPEPVAAQPQRRERVEPQPEPPPPAPVLTASSEAAGPGEWAHPEGEEGGSLQGVPGGRGTGETRDAASEATPEPRPTVSRAELRRRLLGYIRGPLSQHIASHTSYPMGARREHLHGVVILRLRLDADGNVLAVRLSRSSGHSMLDEAALASVRGMPTLPAPPSDLPWDDSQELPLPVTYRLQ